jgi:hypothetical protein
MGSTSCIPARKSQQLQKLLSDLSKWPFVCAEFERGRLIFGRIVAIPGLGADEAWSWKYEKLNWLKETNMLAYVGHYEALVHYDC